MKQTDVTMPCSSIVELNEYMRWLQQNNIHGVGYIWTIVDRQQCISISFAEEKDAMMFILRWA